MLTTSAPGTKRTFIAIPAVQRHLTLTGSMQPVHCVPCIGMRRLSILTGGGAIENRFATGLWRRQPAADAWKVTETVHDGEITDTLAQTCIYPATR